MGINLWDIGAVATGAIERDREHTAENLKIRADELSAKRNALILRKNKKYDAEIKSYYKEKGTLDKINSLNAEAAAFNEANKDTDKVYLGLLAQNVETQFPDVVTNESIMDTEDINYKSLHYTGLIAPLIKAIQELSAKVTALENA